MSRQELIGAYVDGRISRRTLVRRLVGAGVSLGAAIGYAGALGSNARAATPSAITDHYPYVKLAIVPLTERHLVKTGKVEIDVSRSETVLLTLNLFRKQAGGLFQIGADSRQLDDAGSERLVITVGDAGATGDVFVACAQAEDTGGLRTFTATKTRLG